MAWIEFDNRFVNLDNCSDAALCLGFKIDITMVNNESIEVIFSDQESQMKAWEAIRKLLYPLKV